VQDEIDPKAKFKKIKRWAPRGAAAPATATRRIFKVKVQDEIDRS